MTGAGAPRRRWLATWGNRPLLALLLGLLAPVGWFGAPAPASAQAIWKLGDDDTTVYLVGTVHMGGEKLTWKNDEVNALIRDADALWLEVKDLANPFAAMAVLMRYGTDTENPLEKRLSPEQLARLDEALKFVGLPRAAVSSMRPWVAAGAIQAQQFEMAGYDSADAIDLQLFRMARTHKVPIEAFETLTGQAALLAGLPDDAEVAMLMMTVESILSEQFDVDEFIDAWREGRGEVFEPLIAQMKQESPVLHDALLTGRNRGFADKILEILKSEGTVVVGVGALHLFGPDSVQAMLSEHGYDATRIQP